MKKVFMHFKPLSSRSYSVEGILEHIFQRMVEVVGGIRVEREIGRPINRLREIYADPAYDSMRIRLYLRLGGIKSIHQ
jgi:hypothetical protein